MPDEGTFDYEPGVLRVLQTKSETKAFYDKIAKVYDLLSEHSEVDPVLCTRERAVSVKG
jgi:hypothetical protein